MTLAKSVFRAGSWSIVGFICVRIIGFVRLTILARLLIPEDFGLFALVTVFIGGIVALSDVGIATAVIQKRDLDDDFLDTAWHLGWMRGLVLAAICWLAAPWLAGFYGHPELSDLLYIAAFIPLIQGLTSMGGPLLQRGLAFDRLLIMTVAHEVIQLLVTIGLAWWLGWGASALVYGLLAGHAVAVVASYIIHDYRPHLRFSIDAVRALWAYGGYLLGAGILIYAMTNLDDAVIGRLLGVNALGYYSVAFMLVGYLTSRIASIFNQVMLPAYSGIQSDVPRMQRVMCRHMHLTTAILTPFAIGAALLPEAVIQLVVGKQWLPAVPVFVVLLLMGWIRGCATSFGSLLMARSRTRGMYKMKWIEFVVFSVSIIPAVYFLGVVGAAWVLVLVYTLSLMLHIWLIRADLGISLRPVLAESFAGALPALASGILTYGFILIFADTINHWGWISGLVFAMLWGSFMWIREKVFIGEVWRMARG